MFQAKISNEDTAQLPPLSFGGDVILVTTESAAEAACADIARWDILGFDTETRPSFKAGVSYQVALLQISTPEKCYLFRLSHMALPNGMVKILESPKIIKIGADILNDLRALKKLKRFTERGFVDLQKIIFEWGIEEKSLRKMSALVLGYRISKAQRLSNWEAVQLTKQQINYAATDAWACIQIYQRLQSTQKRDDKQTIS